MGTPETTPILRSPDDQMRRPDRRHPVKVKPFIGSVTILVDGTKVGHSDRALALSEADFMAIYYLPRTDIDMQKLAPSERITFCPYKGDAQHFSVNLGTSTEESIAWSYEQPYPAMEAIAGYIAFYPNRAEVVADGQIEGSTA